MDVTEKSGPCKCLPIWLAHIASIEASNKGKSCIHCNSVIPTERLANSLVYKCSIKLGRLHVISATYCDTEGECARKFMEFLKAKDYTRYIDICPFSTDTLFSDRSALEQLKALWEKRHRRTGNVCQGCKTLEEESKIFKVCSGCHYKTYCCVECQKQDWHNHKDFCLAKQGDRDALERVTKCDCMDELTRDMVQRANNYQCSATGCETELTPPFEFNCYVAICKLPPEKKTTQSHVIFTHYCSPRCRRIVMQYP